MTLKQWMDNDWLLPHKTSVEEIENLFMIIDRDLKDAEYLDSCRSKRNIVEYDYVGGVTGNDADELIEFVKELKADVLDWLNKNHPELGF
ncbi:MAG: hypothetical protein ISS66_01330 [Desulfobacteraceae bacterium]|nr:hypothetical protein [Desulfobacteraceae bacterium]